MNRTIFSLLVLLLFGLLSQPSIAQSRQQESQRQAEEKVAKMSEAEMRAYLPQAKERLKRCQSELKTGNYYGAGDDAISQGVAKAAAEAFYYYYTAAINAIEKRLSKIDSQKPKPQTEQQKQAETEQQQPEIPDQNLEEQRQIQANLQHSFNEKLEESQPRFNQLHTNVDANAAAAMAGSVASSLVRGYTDPNSVPTTNVRLDKPLSPTSTPKLGDISSKFNNKPKETKEEPEETPKEASNEYDEILRLINELDK